ncbi:dioxygenase [Variovorax sp. UC122_21]|uniref:dioxygenase family protein n=1 Tax=Variovorax sp. UC122_21 TaxID=3374554 RepID=UPI003756983A
MTPLPSDAGALSALGRRGFLMGSALGATAVLGALASVSQAASAAGDAPARRMPVIFIGHGSPMNALADNAFTRRLAAWGRELPRPTAILSVSAHWLSSGATGVGVQARPRTIHDFGGFPQALHDIDYPAPGHPALARDAAAAVKQSPVVATEQSGPGPRHLDRAQASLSEGRCAGVPAQHRLRQARGLPLRGGPRSRPRCATRACW